MTQRIRCQCHMHDCTQQIEVSTEAVELWAEDPQRRFLVSGACPFLYETICERLFEERGAYRLLEVPDKHPFASEVFV